MANVGAFIEYGCVERAEIAQDELSFSVVLMQITAVCTRHLRQSIEAMGFEFLIVFVVTDALNRGMLFL